MPGMKPDVKYEINLDTKQGLSCFQLNPCFLGGARRNRTDDLYNAIVALSQLSYGPTFWALGNLKPLPSGETIRGVDPRYQVLNQE